jgi:hypothetical protein
MLALRAFLIFVFSSSVIARPVKPHVDTVPGSPAPLLHNPDPRLRMGVWALVVPASEVLRTSQTSQVLRAPLQVQVPAPVENAPASAALQAPKVQVPHPEYGSYNYKLDALIQFEAGDIHGQKRRVGKLNLLHLQRQLSMGWYKVACANGNSFTVPVAVENQQTVPLGQWRSRLAGTYWGRIPELVGSVSNSCMIWRH